MVLESFEAVVNGHTNLYHRGHAYTVRPGESWDDLDSKVAGWQADGKVVVVGVGTN
jgi:hypothetical protein